ncbi:hypothetical protein VTN77DRAFT_1374 [Rasamsonia byssochlamydoides]|uniref:uncharacterized protein n=1 Tax=Rasamsonia byssochlamydoides TaxID=89139 RepID=UPI003743C803
MSTAKKSFNGRTNGLAACRNMFAATISGSEEATAYRVWLAVAGLESRLASSREDPTSYLVNPMPNKARGGEIPEAALTAVKWTFSKVLIEKELRSVCGPSPSRRLAAWPAQQASGSDE